MTRDGDRGDVLSALLDTEMHAAFLVEPSLKVRVANLRAHILLGKGEVIRLESGRLVGRTNRIDFELRQALCSLLKAVEACPTGSFEAPCKRRYTFELIKLETPTDPLVLVRVYEGYAAPDTSGATALKITERPPNAVARRLSADGKHGPAAPKRRPPLPPLPPLRAFEAYARLGSMAAAAVELDTFPMTISRHVRDLEAATRRSLIEGERHRIKLTPAGRQLARALTDAFDTLEATVRPRPEGKRRGRPAQPAAGVGGRQEASAEGNGAEEP